MTKLSEIKLKKVQDSDIRFLYQLLKNRDPKKNISHRNMPTFTEHQTFVLKKPYSKWYIIYYDSRKIGSVYVSKINEIGINLKKQYDSEEIRNNVINEIISNNQHTRYFANVSPKNKKELKFFEKKGWKLIQKTFEFDVEKSDKK